MGHGGTSNRDDYHTSFYAISGATRVSLHLDEASRKAAIYNRYTAPRPEPRGKTVALLGPTFKSKTDDMGDAPSMVDLRNVCNRGAFERVGIAYTAVGR